MQKFENLKRVNIEELEKLNAAYANKSEFSKDDAETYKCLIHALKCMLTVEAMMEASEGEWDGGFSGRRGRNMNNGQYMSRDGWDQGQQSGHYPPPWYPDRGRW